MNRHEIIDIICERLNQEKDSLKKMFSSAAPWETRFFYVDDLLPEAMAMEAYQAFPQESSMRKLESFREKKLTTKNLEQFSPLLSDITFAIQDPRVIKITEEITGFGQLLGDEQLYAGGLSMMKKNHFLNPHIDNSHNHDRSLYRRANLLYYISPRWQEDYGGNLELWDQKVKQPTTIFSKFNRLVFMETTHLSWHSVSPITVEANRCCISNYYFSEISPSGQDYFHVTSFSARPEQKIRRLVSGIDNYARSLARQFKKTGFAQKDLYQKQ